LVARIHDLWPAFVLLAVTGTVTLGWILRREFRTRPRYAAILSGVVMAAFGFYGLVALWRETGGLDERFFKPVGFLILPGLLAAISGLRQRLLAWTLGFTFACSCLYGVASYANRAVHLHRTANPGRRGITQHELSPEALQALHRLDETLPPGSLIVLPSPEMALEVRRTRALATDATMRDAKSISQWRYRGRVPGLCFFQIVRWTLPASVLPCNPPSSIIPHRPGSVRILGIGRSGRFARIEINSRTILF
jgi:hypothetical protein